MIMRMMPRLCRSDSESVSSFSLFLPVVLCSLTRDLRRMFDNRMTSSFLLSVHVRLFVCFRLIVQSLYMRTLSVIASSLPHFSVQPSFLFLFPLISVSFRLHPPVWPLFCPIIVNSCVRSRRSIPSSNSLRLLRVPRFRERAVLGSVPFVEKRGSLVVVVVVVVVL